MVFLGVFPKPIGDVARPAVQTHVSVANSVPAQATTVSGGTP
jgi:hypothetical protein